MLTQADFQNIQSGIMIPVQDKLATRAPIGSLGKSKFLSMTALRAILRCVSRVYPDNRSTSIFSFVDQQGKKHRPCRITNAFGKAAVVNHSIDFKVLHSNESETIDDFPSSLMGKVMSAEGNAFMNTSNRFPPSASLWVSFGFLAEFLLSFGKFFFIRAKKTRVVNMLAIGEGSKRSQTHINTYLFPTYLERLGAFHFTGKRNIPFPRGRTTNGASLWLTFQRAMQNNFNNSNFS